MLLKVKAPWHCLQNLTVAFSLFNCGFPPQSPPPSMHANPFSVMITFTLWQVRRVVRTLCKKFPTQMVGKGFALSAEILLLLLPQRRWALIERFVITSHHIELVIGGWERLVSSLSLLTDTILLQRALCAPVGMSRVLGWEQRKCQI